jgi:hypothetical protein
MAARKTEKTSPPNEVQVKLRPIEVKQMRVRIEGRGSYVQHRWDEKNRKAIRDKKTGDAPRRVREKCVPENECEAATYRLSDGRYAIPVTSIKKAMMNAAHKDYGIPRTIIARSVFFFAEEGVLIPLDTPGHKMREDVVRVGNSQADLRYRPEFEKWGAELLIEYNTRYVTPDIIVNLLEEAGHGIGVGEGRPEKQSGLDWGRFTVKSSKEVKS